MKFVLVLCLLIAVAVAYPDATYDPKFDNFDAAALVDNPRLLTGYGKCFLKEGPCTSEGKSISKIVPEAIRTSCAKCTPKQRDLVRLVVHAFQDKEPEIWNRLVKKEDPKGEYIQSFNEFLARTD